MKVSVGTTKLQKLLGKHKELVKAFGDKRAKMIEKRVAFLGAAPNLQDVPQTKPFRCHELTGKRKGEFAVNVEDQLRIVFIPNHDPVPRKPDGGIDKKIVTEITIIEVEDYH